ncbi:oligoendopeptidase F [Kyrpidia spormannii]|uniref:Oligopeptidase F n=1 Tax=Kyrpidia spormannii TaxID=2055160 RepID=A0A6F9EDL1_9BACL|nr:oligoendopeptidase F [Kyrpidia spormannii]CAB3394947.1 oligoendopeptidase F [Kyrpidia spormannii]
MTTVRSRAEIPVEDTWKLEDLYPDDQAWEREFQDVQSRLGEVEAFRGRVLESAETLLAVLRLEDDLSLKLERLYAYSHMRKDEDTTNSTYLALADRAQGLAARLAGAFSFVVPEILAGDVGVVQGYIDSHSDLALYRHKLDDILRRKPHVLSAAEEAILAQVSEIAQGPTTIFSMVDDADLRLPTIRDEQGQEVELTKGRYSQFLESQDRRVRQDAFTAFYAAYKERLNTLSATYHASVKKDVFYARVRKYGSSLEAALDDDRVPVEVYDNLIAAVHEFLPALHRYLRLRKKVLGLNDLHMYDLYVPLVPEIHREVSFDEAKKTVLEGLAPMGEEYLGVMRDAFASRWVDVHENRGKRGGAYSWGAYGTHPYVLLNWQPNIDNVFTLAHEMGHAMHSHYTYAHQPYVYGGYSIFVAEVASTCNESLLLHHLLKNTPDEAMRRYLLNHHLEQFRTTVFRQVMFAEFEKLTHEAVEAGHALTSDWMCDTYRRLNETYYGAEAVIDEQIAWEWARIPHFYTAFYVYKYATGFSAATALSRRILEEGEPAVRRYLDFLSAGSSDYPLEVLAKAGVDMRSPEPVRQALQVFEETVAELEKSFAGS